MTKPIADSYPSQDDPDAPHLVGVKLHDQLSDEGQESPDERELSLEEEAVLANFRGHRRIVAEWFVRHSDVRITPSAVMEMIPSDSDVSRKSATFLSFKNIGAHSVLGAYFYKEKEGNISSYWLSSEWQQSDELPKVVDKYCNSREGLGKTALAGQKPTAQKPVQERQSHPVLEEDEIGTFQRAGRQPTFGFEMALRRGRAIEAPLSEYGLRIVQYQDEMHIFMNNRHIATPLEAIAVLQVLSLRPEGLNEKGVEEDINKYLPEPMSRRSIRAYLAVLEEQLRGTGALDVKRSINQLPQYRIAGAFPREQKK